MATRVKKADLNGKAEKTRAASSGVVLRDLNIETKRVRVYGLSPYICHAWSKKAIGMIEDKQQKKASKPREAKNPEEEFESCFYRDAKGQYCIPARSFKSACVSASTSINDRSFPKTMLRQAMFVIGDLLPIIHKTEPNMRCDPVIIGQGTADLRYRPEFPEWQVDLDIQYNASLLSIEQLVNLIDLAGFAVGVGEWRPECNGNNGRFTVKNPG